MIIVIVALICTLILFLILNLVLNLRLAHVLILAWLTTTKSHFTLSVPPLLGWDGCITNKGHTEALKNAELSLRL